MTIRIYMIGMLGSIDMMGKIGRITGMTIRIDMI